MIKQRAFLVTGIFLVLLSAAASVNAQDKDSCAGVGWEPYYIEQLGDIAGTHTITQNRDCKESAKWQYAATITIRKTKEGGYVARVYSKEKETDFRISGSQVRFARDITGSTGGDKHKRPDQFWTGTLQRNRRTGSIRIYGTWTGAFDYVTDNTNFNHDFMIAIK